ncbi:hypothetical protein [Labilithrix luteola]|nr:hypothetical protein [Labilithrix luteola]
MPLAPPDEIELTDDDLSIEDDDVDVEYEVDLGGLAVAAAPMTRASLANDLVTREVSTREARRGLPPPLESDIAECLATIAAEASKISPAVAPATSAVVDPSPVSVVPSRLVRAKSPGMISRLPAIVPPPHSPHARTPSIVSGAPFLRAQKRPAQLVDDRDEVVEHAKTLPRAVRSPYLDQVMPRPSVFSRPSFTPPTPSRPVKASAAPGGSVAPVALSAPREAAPTVVVHASPRSRFWLAGVSAVVGALAAFAAVRFVPSAPPAAPAVAVQAPPPAPQAVQEPKIVRTPAAPSASATPVAVLKFDESEAVDITVPAAASSEMASAAPVVVPVAHRVKPRRAAPRRPAPVSEPTLGGRVETPAAPVAVAPPAPPPPAPVPAPSARKRWTAEQELAEAQLKASMK